MAASVSASASNHLSSDQPRSGASSSSSPAGPLRRLSQLRAYTQSHFLSSSSSSSSFFPSSTTSHRLSRRNTHSTRSVRSASSTAVTTPAPGPTTGSEPLPPSSSAATVGTPPTTTTTTTTTTTATAHTTGSAPCSESEQQPTLTLDSSILFPSGLDIDLGFPASSPDLLATTDSDDRPSTQGQTMARHRGSSQPPETLLEGTTPSAPSTLQPGLLDSADPVMTENSSISPRPKQKATIRFFPHQDSHQSSRPSLPFIPISRTLPSDSCVIRVGRYSERDGLPAANPSEPSDAPVGFKSKVVSRKHCEFLYMNGQWHIKDVGSSSGTFLNHMRLSQPNMASRLYTVKDGDIVQLGIDFRGGEEMIFRCVRIRIECNRSWQQQPNEFNKNTESLIRNLGKGETADYSGCRECSICLGSVLRPYQCLFMAACAHVWHYKCVSRLIHTPDYPMFQCPNCRAYTDLSAEVDDSNDYEEVEQKPTTMPEKKDTEALRGEPESNTSSSNTPSANTSSFGSNRSSDGHRRSEDHLSTSLPMEAGLAANIENMRFDHHDEPTEAAAESPRSTDPSLTTSTSDRSTNSDVPGWQSIARTPSAVHCRQAHLRSDTPVRSDSSDENPLTPMNDSGPLAFDGRAGMS